MCGSRSAVEGDRVKQRHRVRAALGASAALAVGAGVALAAVPTPQPASKPVTKHLASATYPTTSAELARLRDKLTRSAHDTALLQSVIARLQHQVDAAQARLEHVPHLGGQPATSTGAAPTRPAQPVSTTVPRTPHRSPPPQTPPPQTPPPQTPRPDVQPTPPSPSDDDPSDHD
jgi:hypothetical protein